MVSVGGGAEAGACRFKGRKLSVNDLDIFLTQSDKCITTHAESYTTKTNYFRVTAESSHDGLSPR